MVRTVNICMAIRMLSETDDSGNIPWRCVTAGSDGVGVNECKYRETKLYKRVGSMWASWRLQESTWVNALLHDRELECPMTGFQLCSCYLLRTHLIESVSVKQRLSIPGNALGLSDTVPGVLFELVCHYLQAGSSRAYTYHAHQWTLVGSTSYT